MSERERVACENIQQLKGDNFGHSIYYHNYPPIVQSHCSSENCSELVSLIKKLVSQLNF